MYTPSTLPKDSQLRQVIQSVYKALNELRNDMDTVFKDDPMAKLVSYAQGMRLVSAGTTVVTTTGTPVGVASVNEETRVVWVQAKETNTGNVYLGDGASQVISLASLDAITLPVDLQAAMVYLDADNNGEGISYMVLGKSTLEYNV